MKLCFFPYRQPRGFAFVQFVDSYEASEAQYHMDRQIFAGREISVVVAAETRKRPEEMRHRTSRSRGPGSYGGQRSSYHGNLCTNLRLIEASGSHRHKEHQDHPLDLDLDQDLLICLLDVEDEVALQVCWQCATGLCTISLIYQNIYKNL
ncbi:hypothetical protein TSUD_212240 [Trifolium subterraneum]|uniref:RRM domain-containing protein n=1 Tax=Trifolium subterraneum TaxID=3900 RepID=A0A2Z6NMQ1_TRISU|nr:hypothetical protein TSUD_212240 [Trifolium subterraneum]